MFLKAVNSKIFVTVQVTYNWFKLSIITTLVFVGQSSSYVQENLRFFAHER